MSRWRATEPFRVEYLGPRPLELPNGQLSSSEPFVEYARSFVARNGAWPGGVDYQSAESLREELKQGLWYWGVSVFAVEIPEERELVEDLVPVVDVIPLLRRSVDAFKGYLWRGAFPALYRTRSGPLVFEKADIDELVKLAAHTPEVRHYDTKPAAEAAVHVMFFPSGTNGSRATEEQLVIENVPHLTRWQLSRVVDVIMAGPDAESRELPREAPRRWRQRTAAEKINGPGFVSPPEFLEAVWKPWLETGRFREDEIEDRDPELISAYRRWLKSHPYDRHPGLKPARRPLERRAYGITNQTPWEEVVKIAMAIVQDRRRKSRDS